MKKSFTLAEFLIAVSIALLLISASVIVFSRSSNASAAKSDAQQLESFVNKARNFASNPEDENAVGYGVKFINEKTAQVYKVLPESTQEEPLSQPAILILSNSQMSNFSPIFFEAPSGRFSNSSGESRIINFRSKKRFFSAESTAVLTIGANGQTSIEVGKLNETATPGP